MGGVLLGYAIEADCRVHLGELSSQQRQGSAHAEANHAHLYRSADW